MKATQKLQNLFLFGLVVIVLATGSTAIGYFVTTGARDADLPKSVKTEIAVQVTRAEKQSSQMDATYTLVDFLDSTPFDSQLERSSALYDLFAHVDLEMLPDYWEQAQNLEASNVRAEIQNVIIQRWSVLDQIAALDVIEREAADARKHVLFDFVFHEWSLIDLESAVDYVGGLEKDAQQRAIASVVRAREDLTYKQRREIARRLDCEWVAINVLRETTDSAVIDKPAQEWRSFIWENKDDLPNLSEAQNRMLGQLAYSWIVRDGVDAFEKMRHSLPSDFSLLEITKSVSLELIDANPQLAFDLVVAGKLREKETAYLQLAMDVVTEWAKTDPSKAFDATGAVIGQAFQMRLRQRLLWAWAQNNPESLLNSVGEIPKSLQLKARKTAFTYIARQSPHKVRAMLSSVADPNYRNVIADSVVKGWALTDLPGTLEWIDSDDSLAAFRYDLQRSAYFSLAKENPKLAVQTAAKQPLNNMNEGWEAWVVIWTADDNLDIAAGLLEYVRPGKTRSRAYNSVVELVIEEQDWERAINLVIQYDDQEKQILGKQIGTLSREIPIRLYNKIEDLESPWLKRSVAWQLFVHNKDNGTFAEEQLAQLKELTEKPVPKRPQRERSARLQEAIENFNRVYEEEKSD
ncbi:MAG: hypothetical protein F4X56_03840 [Gammaproteobacteria bacterium]|nr:hypothetical protein [Gammaproteobacteria bacterium]